MKTLQQRIPDLVRSRLTQEVPYFKTTPCNGDHLGVVSGTFPTDILTACDSVLCETQGIASNHTMQIFRAYTPKAIATGKSSLYMNRSCVGTNNPLSLCLLLPTCRAALYCAFVFRNLISESLPLVWCFDVTNHGKHVSSAVQLRFNLLAFVYFAIPSFLGSRSLFCELIHIFSVQVASREAPVPLKCILKTRYDMEHSMYGRLVTHARSAKMISKINCTVASYCNRMPFAFVPRSIQYTH